MTKKAIDRDSLLDAVLSHVMFDGWSPEAVKRAAEDLNVDVLEFDLHFPKGIADMIARYVERADIKMEEELAKHDLASMKIREKITLAVWLRLEMVQDQKDVVRKTLTWLSLPANSALGVKLTASTVSRIWYAIGDASTDFAYYTKRITLSAVYGSTLLYWLDDMSEDHEKTRGFLDRRIENVMQFERFKFRTRECISKKPDLSFVPRPGRFFRNLKAR